MAEPQEDRPRTIPIDWHIPDHIISRYATNMVIQPEINEYIIMFFELHPPLLIGSLEEVQETLDSTKTVRADCVARIIVAKDKLPDFVEILQRMVDRQTDEESEESDESEETEASE